MANMSHPPQLRVLVADDNPDMRKTVAHLLEEEFDVVGIVADGRSLVEAASRLKPNIGIVDISMPLMSGIEAAKEIKRSGLEMKIVRMLSLTAGLRHALPPDAIIDRAKLQFYKTLSPAKHREIFWPRCC